VRGIEPHHQLGKSVALLIRHLQIRLPVGFWARCLRVTVISRGCLSPGTLALFVDQMIHKEKKGKGVGQ
jgi:hypothetical protein